MKAPVVVVFALVLVVMIALPRFFPSRAVASIADPLPRHGRTA